MIAAGFALTAVAMVALVRGRTGTAERLSGPLPAAVVPWNPQHNRPMSVAITEPTLLPVPGGKPAVPVIGAPPGTRPCTSADLTLISSFSQPTPDPAGWVTTQYTLRSRATSDCAISPYGQPTR
jgi:hypothetical protein